MAWSPRWKHVTQVHGDGWGWNDCAEASLARAILEYDTNTQARQTNTEWDLVRNVHNPNAPAGPWDLIDRLSVLARGYHDDPQNGFTSWQGIYNILNAFGLSYTQFWGPDASLSEVQNNDMVLCWVDGVQLAPASAPASAYGGDAGYDHFILSLPSGNLFNDPLTLYNPNTGAGTTSMDVRYDWTSVYYALGGCLVLPSVEGVAQLVYRVNRDGVAMKGWANHLGMPANNVVEQLNKGHVLQLTGKRTNGSEVWVEVKDPASGRHGWVTLSALTAS